MDGECWLLTKTVVPTEILGLFVMMESIRRQVLDIPLFIPGGGVLSNELEKLKVTLLVPQMVKPT